MIIRLTVHAPLLQYLAVNRDRVTDSEWEVAEGTTAGEVLKRLNFPDDSEVGLVLNDVFCLDGNRVMQDGDSLFVVPFITGG
jgi:sulfur carrier protein ThiS